MTAATPTTTAGTRKRLGLVVLALPVFVLAVNIAGLLLALPNLGENTGGRQNWFTDLFGAALAALLG